jgi:hypothetical protein
MQSLFHAISDGFFPMEMTFRHLWEIRFMFAFYAIGFFLLSLNFIALYLYAMKKHKQLALTKVEYFDSFTEVYKWLCGVMICAVSLVFSLWLPSDFLGFSGYVFFALFPLLTFVGWYRGKDRVRMITQLGDVSVISG